LGFPLYYVTGIQAFQAKDTSTMPEISDIAPDFTLPVTGGGDMTLSALKGAPVVLFFYPRDDTPGCTKESIGFSASLSDFEAAGARVFGISRDTLAKHDKFVAKHDLTVPLLSDEGGSVTEAYGVWVEKSMYGKTSMGIERATFLIGADGKIAQVWRKVKVPGHVEAVLEAVRAL
jgi:peroxiredoxin Q/BCP